MIRVNFDPDKLTGEQKEWWDKWHSASIEYTKEAIEQWENGQNIKFHDTHWGKLKDWLLSEIFNNKCAYCETIMDRAAYHAEHFRPKGEVAVRDGVTLKNKKVQVENPLGEVVEHPGYFWLAYNWKNLLPSCQNCNTYGGKGIQFPSLKGHIFLRKYSAGEITKTSNPYYESKKFPEFYYLNPGELDRLEEPLLLHPYFDDPEKYLAFGIKGLIAPLDNNEKGINSIQVYNLKDEKIRQGRQEAQESASRLVGSYFEAIYNKENIQAEAEKEITGSIEKYIEGKAKYSAAVVAFLNIKMSGLMHIFKKD